MKKTSIILIAIFLTLGIYAQKNTKTQCKLWKPANFCNLQPDSFKLPRVIIYDSTSTNSFDCKQINENSTYKAVRIKLTRKNGSVLRLKSNFSNISLTRKSDNKVIHPFALLWYSGWDKDGKKELFFLSSNFTTTGCKAKFSFMKYVDLILIFTEADLGDKIKIDDYLETEIQE